MATQDGQSNRPLHTLRHRNLKVAIWRNQTDKGPMYNVTILRSYRDKATNEWRDTSSLGYDHLMNVAALLQEAHTMISGLMARDAKRSKPARSNAPVKS